MGNRATSGENAYKIKVAKENLFGEGTYGDVYKIYCQRIGKEIDKITWKTVLRSGYVFDKYLPFHWTIPAKLFNDPPHYLLWYNDIFV